MDARLKTTIADSMRFSGFLNLLESAIRPRMRVIFTFHRVLPPVEMGECYNPYLAITPESFDAFLTYARARFTVLPLDVLVRFEDPAPVCAITFDDGWEDNHRWAFPVLQRHRLPATVFLCAGLIGTDASIPEEALWRVHQAAGLRSHDLLSRLAALLPGAPPEMDYNRAQQLLKRIPMQRKTEILRRLEDEFGIRPRSRPSMMSWEQAKAMAAAGIAFGSHTLHHSIISVEVEPAARTELAGSLEELRARFSQETYSFAYPNGGFNASVMRLAEEAGYAASCTTQVAFVSPQSPRHALPRFGVDNLVVNDAADRFSPARARLQVLRGGLFTGGETAAYS